MPESEPTPAPSPRRLLTGIDSGFLVGVLRLLCRTYGEHDVVIGLGAEHDLYPAILNLAQVYCDLPQSCYATPTGIPSSRETTP